MIEEQHFDKATKNNKGSTPLSYACAEGHLNVVRYLIEEQHVDKETKGTPLIPKGATAFGVRLLNYFIRS